MPGPNCAPHQLRPNCASAAVCALLIDATPFAGQQMVAAIGIRPDGREMILGRRQGATENAAVVGELLDDLLQRGLDFTTPRLYVLDGGKALHAAVKTYAGSSALMQRCQVPNEGTSSTTYRKNTGRQSSNA